MENKLAKIVAVLTVAGLMAAGSVAYAESRGDNPKSDKSSPAGMAGLGFIKALNLTPEQTEKFWVQHEAKTKSNESVAEQMKTKTDALNTAVAKLGTKRADVNGLVDEVSALQKQVLSQRMDFLFGMKEILTPDQFAVMLEMNKQGMKRGLAGLGNKSPAPEQN